MSQRTHLENMCTADCSHGTVLLSTRDQCHEATSSAFACNIAHGISHFQRISSWWVRGGRKGVWREGGHLAISFLSRKIWSGNFWMNLQQHDSEERALSNTYNEMDSNLNIHACAVSSSLTPALGCKVFLCNRLLMHLFCWGKTGSSCKLHEERRNV